MLLAPAPFRGAQTDSDSAQGERPALMSLTDVVLSLFLFQAAVAVVQLFPVRGSDRELGPFCVRPPSLFTFHPVSVAGY